MTREIDYNPFGDTKSTYRTPEARSRRRGSWIRAGVGLLVAGAVIVCGGSWAVVTSAEEKAQNSVEDAYTLGSIATSTDRDEITIVMAAMSLAAAEEENPDSEVNQDEIRAEVDKVVEELTSPMPEIRLGSSSGELRDSLSPPMVLCTASLAFPPEQPDLSTLNTTCVDFQDAVFTMIQKVSSYNDIVEMLGPLSWGRDPVPELMDQDDVHSMLDPAMLGGR